MNKKYKIGIDIGGTNTDAALVDDKNRIVYAAKTATTGDIDQGFRTILHKLLDETKVSPEGIRGIYLGTTHATNAILQQKDLYKVGVIRIAGQYPESFPSCYAWPREMREAIHAGTVCVDGGYHCDGRTISAFDEKQVKAAVAHLLDNGAESLAVVGVFAPMNAAQEIQAKKVIQGMNEDLPVSMSHQIGGVGFIERENSTILNAALKKVMATGFAKLEQIKKQLSFSCPLWITQNNGSIIGLAHAIDYPVLTISAGPTNSFIGGAKLSGLADAIVVDIGGTSTDVGVVRKGYPRRCLNNSQIGGISLNFSMPDVLSIALGGGSHIALGDKVQIGPQSCARRIITEGISFGGNQLTLTDIALAMGHVAISGSDPTRVMLSKEDCARVMQAAQEQVQRLVEKMGIDEKHLPVVLIGGGASLIPQEMLPGHYCIPDYANVANAYGAALAEIAATVDTVISLEKRETALQQLQEAAITQAVQQGSRASATVVVDLQIIPYHYVPNQMARVVVTASGPSA